MAIITSDDTSTATTEPVEPWVTTKTCRRCGEADVDQLLRNAHAIGGVASLCRPCLNSYRRSLKATGHLGITAVNEAVDTAPDPRPAVRLRQELQARRDQGRTFNQAWPISVSEALRGFARDDQISWRGVFSGTKDAWDMAYARSSSGPAMFVHHDEHDQRLQAL